MTIWNRYGVQSWPTLVLIDPEGEAVWVGNGERKFEDVKAIIERGLPYYRSRGPAQRGTASRSSRSPNRPTRRCGFPARCWPTSRASRLFIADSNHNRIVVTDLDGKVQAGDRLGCDRPRGRSV